MSGNRNHIDRTNAKVFATKDDTHCELNFDYRTMQQYTDIGYAVYAINKEGIFFFLNNRNNDGFDWCKITKRDNLP